MDHDKSQQPPDDNSRRDLEEDGGDAQSDRDHRQPPPKQPSMIKSLLITASVALVCGVIGAMGYTYFFDAGTKASSSDPSKAKTDSKSSKASGGDEKSAGGDSSESGKASNTQASPASSTKEVEPEKASYRLEQRITEVSQRVDNLRARIDDITRPTDGTPPSVRTLQIKMSEFAHEMATVAALPESYRHFDNRLEILEEQLKVMRARVDAARAGSTGARVSDLNPLIGIVVPDSNSGGGKPTEAVRPLAD